MKNLLVEIHHEARLWDLLQFYSAVPEIEKIITFWDPEDVPVSVLILCTEVRQDGAFVRLVLNREEKHHDALPEAISVPTDLVAWIAEQDHGTPIGFAQRLTPRR